MKDYVDFAQGVHTLSPNDIAQRSPNLAGTGILAVIRHNNGYALLGQIQAEGTAGNGGVHGALAGGGVDATDLEADDPLSLAARREALEEVALVIPSHVPLSFDYLVDERAGGNIPLCSVHAVDGDAVLDAYMLHTQNLVRDREAEGLVAIPFDETRGGLCLDALVAWVASTKGLTVHPRYTPRTLSKQVYAIHEFFKDSANVGAFLDKAHQQRIS
jgi:8-oxo-dGTP pyrophosphatase MutT (NUDIX family)